MTDNEDAAAGLLVHLFKDTDEILKAPKVDAGFWFIEERQRSAAGEHHSNFDTFHFTAGKGSIQLTVQVIFGTKSYS